MADSPLSPCFSCQHRHDSKRRVEDWRATGATRGPVLDPAPHVECKDHPGYGVEPEASRPACEDWRAVAKPEPLAVATTVIHDDAGDGPFVAPQPIPVPRGVPGRRARILVLPEEE